MDQLYCMDYYYAGKRVHVGQPDHSSYNIIINMILNYIIQCIYATIMHACIMCMHNIMHTVDLISSHNTIIIYYYYYNNYCMTTVKFTSGIFLRCPLVCMWV